MAKIYGKRRLLPMLATVSVIVAVEFGGSVASAQTTTTAAPLPPTLTGLEPCSPYDYTPCVIPNLTRTVTILNQTIKAVDGGKYISYSYITGQYNVEDNGLLTIGGHYNDPQNPYNYGNISITSSINLKYTGVDNNTIVDNFLHDNIIINAYDKYTTTSLTLNSLSVSGSGNIGYKDYGFASVDGTLSGTSTQIAGRYYDADISSGLSYGTLAGTVSLTAAPAGSTAPLQFQIGAMTLTQTTHLDETGLTTPKIAVTGGIDMGGSAITNLAAGTTASDAVNLAQLAAETTARQTSYAALAAQIAGLGTGDGGGVDPAALAAEITARTDADTRLTTAVAGETAARAGADTHLQTGIDSEIAARTSTDTRLAAGIDSEASARTAADTTETNARQGADAALNAVAVGEATTRAGADAQLQTGLDTETAARTSADTKLGTRIDSEASARTAADTAETNARQGADATLNTMIVGEAATRASADAQLQTGLTTETAARTIADTKLGTRIDSETSARAAADTAEVAARQSADTALNAMIADEATIRAGADARLSQRIDHTEAVDNTLAQGLATESAARIAGDAALSARIDSMGTRLDQVDSRLDRLDQKVSSSTAVAVAMGGAAFLPDTRFNLTANVATYDGAQAGAVQFGAMIGPKLAVNAGVATGFSKGGKTAARAGFTIGW